MVRTTEAQLFYTDCTMHIGGHTRPLAYPGIPVQHRGNKRRAAPFRRLYAVGGGRTRSVRRGTFASRQQSKLAASGLKARMSYQLESVMPHCNQLDPTV
ncbi:MAG: hypothetical protein NZ606_08110, partial [Candidatus Kapabacteria bacterium]|nr:hypothetical protein [Candidatus Kapabacteria bacterium]